MAERNLKLPKAKLHLVNKDAVNESIITTHLKYNFCVRATTSGLKYYDARKKQKKDVRNIFKFFLLVSSDVLKIINGCLCVCFRFITYIRPIFLSVEVWYRHIFLPLLFAFRIFQEIIWKVHIIIQFLIYSQNGIIKVHECSEIWRNSR